MSQGEHVFHDAVDVGRHHTAARGPIEIQHALHDLDQPLHLGLGHAQILQAFIVAKTFVQAQVQTVVDRLERIVDLVSNGSGQPADGGHLLRLHKLCLGTLQHLCEIGQLTVQIGVIHCHCNRGRHRLQ